MATVVLAEPVFVGREKEFGELKQYLDSVIQGKGLTVFISGEAGSGKSRLVKEFLATVRAQGVTVIAGWCLSNSGVPFLPFIQAFNNYYSGGTSQKTKEIGIVAWLSGPRQKEMPPEMSPQVWKDQAFIAVSKTLHEISEQTPVILILEDIHWADSASLALLQFLARAIGEEKILIIATYRSEELTTDAEGHPHPLSEKIRLMNREDLLKELKLPNLNEDNVKQIAENMIGGNVGQQLVEKLDRQSNGNALFVVESLKMLVEGKNLVQENNIWRTAHEEVEIPSKIKDIIMQRLAVLNFSQRKLLDVASVIGEKFYAGLLAEVIGQENLETLENLNLVAQSTSIVYPDGEFYRFDHARSKETLYDALALPLKKGYHARIAERLESTGERASLPLADLAYHYVEAGNREKALAYSLAAGKEALARWSNLEAVKHFQYVLRSIGDSPERFNDKMIALEGLGDAYYANNNFKDAANAYEQFADVQTGIARLRVLRKEAITTFWLGDTPLATRLTQKAEENASADRLEAGYLFFMKSGMYFMAGDATTSIKMNREATQIFEEEDAIWDLARTLITIFPAAMLGYLEETVEDNLRAIAMYEELGDVRSLIEAYFTLGNTFYCCTLTEESNRMLVKAIELNEQSKIYDHAVMVNTYLIWSYNLMEDDLQNSISKALKALEYCEKIGSNISIGGVYECLVVEYAMAGDLTRMEQYYEEFMKLPEYVRRNFISTLGYGTMMGVYYATKKEYDKSYQYFKEHLVSVPNPSAETGINLLQAWTALKQRKFWEAMSKKRQSNKIRDSTHQRFSHVNIHAGLMTNTRPQANQIFNIRLDLINVSKSQGSIVKIEKLLAPALEIVDVSSNCLLHDGMIELKEKAVNPFEVKTIKLAVKATKPLEFQLTPTVTYLNDLGETKTSSTRTFTITVSTE